MWRLFTYVWSNYNPGQHSSHMILFSIILLCVGGCREWCAYTCKWQRKQEKDIRYLPSGVTGSYKLPNMDVGNQTQVLSRLFMALPAMSSAPSSSSQNWNQHYLSIAVLVQCAMTYTSMTSISHNSDLRSLSWSFFSMSKYKRLWDYNYYLKPRNMQNLSDIEYHTMDITFSLTKH